MNGLDALAFAAHTGHRKICSIIDIKRDEFAFCTYKPVPGGVVRESEPEVLNENTLKQKLNEDNEKKLIVGDWNELNEKIIKTARESNEPVATALMSTRSSMSPLALPLGSRGYPHVNSIWPFPPVPEKAVTASGGCNV